MCFDVHEKPLGDYILRCNNFGLIYKLSKDIARKQKWQSLYSSTGESGRRSFICGSRSHLKNECPEHSKSSTSRSNAKVNTCQLQTQQSMMGAHTPVNAETTIQPAEVKDAEVQVCVETSVCDESLVDVHEVQSQTDDDNSTILCHFSSYYSCAN